MSKNLLILLGLVTFPAMMVFASDSDEDFIKNAPTKVQSKRDGVEDFKRPRRELSKRYLKIQESLLNAQTRVMLFLSKAEINNEQFQLISNMLLNPECESSDESGQLLGAPQNMTMRTFLDVATVFTERLSNDENEISKMQKDNIDIKMILTFCDKLESVLQEIDLFCGQKIQKVTTAKAQQVTVAGTLSAAEEEFYQGLEQNLNNTRGKFVHHLKRAKEYKTYFSKFSNEYFDEHTNEGETKVVS